MKLRLPVVPATTFLATAQEYWDSKMQQARYLNYHHRGSHLLYVSIYMKLPHPDDVLAWYYPEAH